MKFALLIYILFTSILAQATPYQFQLELELDPLTHQLTRQQRDMLSDVAEYGASVQSGTVPKEDQNFARVTAQFPSRELAFKAFLFLQQTLLDEFPKSDNDRIANYKLQMIGKNSIETIRLFRSGSFEIETEEYFELDHEADAEKVAREILNRRGFNTTGFHYANKFGVIAYVVYEDELTTVIIWAARQKQKIPPPLGNIPGSKREFVGAITIKRKF